MPEKCNLQSALPWSGATARVEVRGLTGTGGKEGEFSTFSEQIQHSLSQGEERYLALAHFNHSVLQVFFLILQPLESCGYTRLPSFTKV